MHTRLWRPWICCLLILGAMPAAALDRDAQLRLLNNSSRAAGRDSDHRAAEHKESVRRACMMSVFIRWLDRTRRWACRGLVNRGPTVESVFREGRWQSRLLCFAYCASPIVLHLQSAACRKSI